MIDSRLGRFFESVRRVTTFLLASFLWVHALFFFNVQSTFVSKYSRLLRLAPSEAVLCALLVIFSFLAASGFWKSLLSLAYIYAFPLVLMWRALRWCFLILRGMNWWFMVQATPPQLRRSSVIDSGTATAPLLPVSPSSQPEPPKKKTAVEILQFLSRPFRRFILLWGALLIVTTHNTVAWACLVVVLVQLAQQIFVMLRLLFFSPWLGDTMKKIGPALLKPVNDHLGALGAVTRDAAPNDDLKKLWTQLNLWRRILDFFGNRYLLSRWAWVLATFLLISIYSYIALLFSFAYYGLARVAGATYSWPEALVNSLFIPFFFSDLPKILAVKILSGVHVSLVLGAGIGTIVNFLGRKLEAIRRAASDVSDRFADQSVHEKLVILEEKFSTTTTALPMESTAGKQGEDKPAFGVRQVS
jgi:hypothetical protein